MCGICEANFHIALEVLSEGIAIAAVMFAMALLGRELRFYPFPLLIVGIGGLKGATLGLSMNACLAISIQLRWLG